MPLSFLPFSNGLVSRTSAEMDLYVDAAVGLDTNPGTVAAPLATITEAERRVPDLVAHAVRIHIAAGTYAAPNCRSRVIQAPMCFVGEGETSLLAGTVAAAATAQVIPVTGGGLVVNAYQGKTLRIGNEVRTIASNDANAITVVRVFAAGAPAQNTPLEVFEPSVIITATTNRPLTEAQLCGTITSGNQGSQVQGGVVFSNFRFTGPALSSVGASAGLVALYGCEADDVADQPKFFRVASGGVMSWGLDSFAFPGAAQLPLDAGLAALNTDWLGWGLMLGASAVVRNSFLGGGAFRGFIVAPDILVTDCVMMIDGCELYGNAALSVGTIQMDSGNVPERAATLLIGGSAATQQNIVRVAAASPVIAVRPGTVVELISACTIIGVAGQPSVFVNGGLLIVRSGTTINTGDYGIWTRNAGLAQFSSFNGSTISGAIAKFAAGPTPATLNVNLNVNDVVRDAAAIDESAIIRYT